MEFFLRNVLPVLNFSATLKKIEAIDKGRSIRLIPYPFLVCYTVVFRVVTQRGALRGDTKSGCVVDQKSFFLCQLLQFSFKNVSLLKNLRQAGRYAEKTPLF